jgi:hypothetical protein
VQAVLVACSVETADGLSFRFNRSHNPDASHKRMPSTANACASRYMVTLEILGGGLGTPSRERGRAMTAMLKRPAQRGKWYDKRPDETSVKGVNDDYAQNPHSLPELCPIAQKKTH